MILTTITINGTATLAFSPQRWTLQLSAELGLCAIQLRVSTSLTTNYFFFCFWPSHGNWTAIDEDARILHAQEADSASHFSLVSRKWDIMGLRLLFCHFASLAFMDGSLDTQWSYFMGDCLPASLQIWGISLPGPGSWGPHWILCHLNDVLWPYPFQNPEILCCHCCMPPQIDHIYIWTKHNNLVSRRTGRPS